MKKTKKKLKAVAGSNRVLLHGTLAEQLRHPFFPDQQNRFWFLLALWVVTWKRNLLWSVIVWWNLWENGKYNDFFFCFSFIYGRCGSKISNWNFRCQISGKENKRARLPFPPTSLPSLLLFCTSLLIQAFFLLYIFLLHLKKIYIKSIHQKIILLRYKTSIKLRVYMAR